MPYKPQHSASFRNWLSKPLGARFIELEANKISTIVPTLFGYNAIILGEADFATSLQNCTIKQKVVVNPFTDDARAKVPTLTSRQDMLPILTESIDLVYLAHCLEFTNNPHEVLREAYRVTRPDGHVLISMFNPLSLWGCWRRFAKWHGNAPWVANFMSLAQLKDWLALLGFDIMRVNHFGYYLPVNKAIFASELSAIEKYGQKYELPFGAAYVVEASKRVIPVTPIRPVWSTEPVAIVSDLAEPTV